MPATKARFHTKAGRLTPYALACGYVERKDNGTRWRTLWLEGTSHVREHDFAEGTRVFWEVFDTLAEARRCFDKSFPKED